MYRILRFVPKNHLSYLVGKIAAIPVPIFLRTVVFKTFASLTGAALGEVEKPLGEYSSVSAFFIRNLKEGTRTIEGDLVSPVDGVLRGVQKIDHVTCEQVKGKTYSLKDLIGDVADKVEESSRFIDGTLMTIYLSPRHYHHVHSPCEAIVRRCDYIPGKLWPVNDWSINSIDSLFSVNERFNIYLSTKWGEVLLVMVGATNVGKMTVTFDDVVSNNSLFGDTKVRTLGHKVAIGAGERLGTFHLGSTVLLMFASDFRFASALKSLPREVKYGENLV